MPTHVLYALFNGTEAESHQRQPPFHGFDSVTDLVRRRYEEQCRVVAVMVRLGCPFLMCAEQKIKKRTEYEDEFSWELLAQDMRVSFHEAWNTYQRNIAKISLQTLMASALLLHSGEYSHAVVYQWDTRPRLVNYSLTPLLQRMGSIGKKKWFGPTPREADVEYLEYSFEGTRSALVAFEDSVMRNVLYVFSDILVECFAVLPLCVNTKSKEGPDARLDPKRAQQVFLTRSCANGVKLFGAALGAAAGTHLNAGHGECWGEALGGMLAQLFLWKTKNTKPYAAN